MGAEVGAGEERRAAGAELHRARPARHCARRDHEPVELEHPLLDGEDVARALDEELRAKPVAAYHLDREAAHVADLRLAPAREPTPFAPHPPRRRQRSGSGRALGPRRRQRLFDAGLDLRAAAKSSDPGHLAAESNARE